MHRRGVLIGLAVVAVLLLLLVGAAGWAAWSYSGQILEPDHSGGDYNLEVKDVGHRRLETVVLQRTRATERAAKFGLEWEGGSARLTRAVRVDAEDDTATRRMTHVSGEPLEAGAEVRLTSGVFQGDPHSALGVRFRDVDVAGELGSFPAWRVDPPEDIASVVGPAPANTWAILVHGINGDRREGLRILPSLREAGLRSLLVTYREDVGAPASPDGLHHMGLTEWNDAEAAAQYALDHGAERLIMVGFSMGGAVVTQFMESSPLAADVEAMILDAPALEWRSIIEFNATELGLPGWTAKPVEWMIGLRIDADWGRLDALQHTDQLAVPTLLFHGTEDDVVPVKTSDRLAAALPDTVTYHRVDGAGHVQSWNMDPTRYDRWVRTWLRDLDRG